jgi:hypothetical protein
VSPPPTALRPARVCGELLEALAASEARSRKRKRDQRPDVIGLGIKRDLLEAAVREDPQPDDFEGWLLDRVTAAGSGGGAVPGHGAADLRGVAPRAAVRPLP